MWDQLHIFLMEGIVPEGVQQIQDQDDLFICVIMSTGTSFLLEVIN
jgi:hypothetical protein